MQYSPITCAKPWKADEILEWFHRHTAVQVFNLIYPYFPSGNEPEGWRSLQNSIQTIAEQVKKYGTI